MSAFRVKRASGDPKTDPREHFALIPRDVVVHRMETADSFESRVFWAIILWSWCGPDASDSFVVKNARGFIQRDSAGNSIPGRPLDLLRLLGLAPTMKGNLSRVIQRLAEKGSIRYEGKILYPVKAPPRAEDTQKVADLTTFTIAGIVVRSDNFPTDPTERAETIRWITELKSEYNDAVTTVRSGYRKLLKQGLSERGIIIVLKEKNSRGSQSVGPVQEEEPEPQEDRPTDPSPEPSPEPPEPPTAEPAPTIEEVRALIIEETAQTHSQEVPGDPVCRDTVSALQGAPVERLRRAIRERFRPRDKIGRIAYLAKDVGELWAMQRQEQLKLEAEQRTREREALEWMAENDENEDARQVARAKLTGKT
jgi:hypothetical protein